MLKALGKFLTDTSGATAIEYGAIIMTIGLALVLVLDAVGGGLSGVFTQVTSVFSAAAPGAGN